MWAADALVCPILVTPNNCLSSESWNPVGDYKHIEITRGGRITDWIPDQVRDDESLMVRLRGK